MGNTILAPLALGEKSTRSHRGLEPIEITSGYSRRSPKRAYTRLRDQKTLDSWYGEGNGLAPKVVSWRFSSPPKALAVRHLPAGVYSHLSPTSTMAPSPRPTTRPRATGTVRAIRKRSVRMSAQLLWKGPPPLYSATPDSCVVPAPKYKFWNDDRVHYQISTAADKRSTRRTILVRGHRGRWRRHE